MTADDDDDGLKSLRAVWLSMPDEDPPERGLADLMAAARVKANEMTARPSLWQRFVESLRRPPVLALATVMVLIGGAVLVGNRSKDMDAQPTVTAPEAQTGTQAVVTESAARDEGRAFSAGSAAEAVPSAPPAIVGGAAPEQPRAEELKAEAPPMKRSEPRAGKDTVSKEKSAPTKSVIGESKKSADTFERRRDEDTMFLDSEGETDQPKQDVATRPSGGTASPKTQAPSDSAALSSAPSVTQLHQSARAAAARGDCDAVRTISRTIAKQDPAYYKAKVVPDASVSRCVIAQ